MRDRKASGVSGEGCISLADLPPGGRGRICSHPSKTPVPERLQELGFVPGTDLEIVRRSPLGSPVELAIRGYRVCLRRVDLSALCVVPAAGID